MRVVALARISKGCDGLHKALTVGNDGKVEGKGPVNGMGAGSALLLVCLGVAILLRDGCGTGAYVAGIRILAVFELACNAKVDQSDTATGQKKEVFRLDIR